MSGQFSPSFLMQLTLGSVLFLPLFLLAFVGGAAALGFRITELTTRRVFGVAMILSVVGQLGLLVGLLVIHDKFDLQIGLGVRLLYSVDLPAIGFMFLSTVVIGVVGNFSFAYLHADSGFRRYFVAYAMFFSGIIHLIAASDLVVFIFGWEFIGLSSVMLIAYFDQRSAPVRNSIVTLISYRVGDIGLLAVACLLHHQTNSHLVPWAAGFAIAPSLKVYVIGGMIFAAMAKSAQLPFSSWLPRAMEGPTPSSAIYYGALSVHAGTYLLWRNEALIETVPVAGFVLVGIGLSTAAYAAYCGRVRSDIKSQLAYASMAQLGLIFAEIGMGWSALAYWHMLGHICIRTLQFLGAPSALHSFRTLKLQRPTTNGGFHVEMLFSNKIRGRLYRCGLAEGHLFVLVDRWLVRPVMTLGYSIFEFDRRILNQLRFFLDSDRKIARSGQQLPKLILPIQESHALTEESVNIVFQGGDA